MSGVGGGGVGKVEGGTPGYFFLCMTACLSSVKQ